LDDKLFMKGSPSLADCFLAKKTPPARFASFSRDTKPGGVEMQTPKAVTGQINNKVGDVRA
jgi:hypothetical protein